MSKSSILAHVSLVAALAAVGSCTFDLGHWIKPDPTIEVVKAIADDGRKTAENTGRIAKSIESQSQSQQVQRAKPTVTIVTVPHQIPMANQGMQFPTKGPKVQSKSSPPKGSKSSEWTYDWDKRSGP
jgi:hypothetical protein